MRLALRGVGGAKDLIVVTPEEIERWGDSGVRRSPTRSARAGCCMRDPTDLAHSVGQWVARADKNLAAAAVDWSACCPATSCAVTRASASAFCT